MIFLFKEIHDKTKLEKYKNVVFLLDNSKLVNYNHKFYMLLSKNKSITKFNMSEDGWAAQLGTSMVDKFANVLVEKPPVYENGEILTNKTRQPFVIVHQYNRLPHLKLKF